MRSPSGSGCALPCEDALRPGWSMEFTRLAVCVARFSRTVTTRLRGSSVTAPRGGCRALRC
jgi:hypothetical protein